MFLKAATILFLLNYNFSNCLERVFTTDVYFDLQNEEVGISGDIDEFGNWDLKRLAIMNQSSMNPSKWSYKVNSKNVHYLYCIRAYNPDNRSETMITKMEASIFPRFSAATEIHTIYGDYGENINQTAFMTTKEEKIVQFQILGNPFVNQLQFLLLKTLKVNSYFNFVNDVPFSIISSITITPKLKNNSITNNYDAQVSIANLTNFDEFKPKNVIKNLKPNDTLLIQIRIPKHYEEISFEFEITFKKGGKNITIIKSSELSQLHGSLYIPVKNYYLKLHYIVVNALPFAAKLNLFQTLESGWDWSNLDIGYHGAGVSSSFAPDSPHYPSNPENTVSSIKDAANLNADMVQLGVAITSDLKIIAHSNTSILVNKNPSGEPRKQSDLRQVFISTMTYKELQKTTTYTVVGNKIYKHIAPNDEKNIDRRLFQEITILLGNIPKRLGVILTVISPFKFLDDVSDEPTIELNVWVNVLLETLILTKHCGHYLIIASFDPNICTMLKLKQNLYPVIQATINKIDYNRELSDPRMSNIKTAVGASIAGYFMGFIASDKFIESNFFDFSFVYKYSKKLIIWFHDGVTNTSTIDFLSETLPVAGFLYNLKGTIKDDSTSQLDNEFLISLFSNSTCFNDTS